MKIQTLRALLFPVLLLIGAPSVYSATVLADDNFELSGTGTGFSSVTNTQSAGVGTYSTIQGTAGMSITTSGSFGAGHILALGNNSNTYYRAFNGVSSGGSAPFSLSSLATGSVLTLSFNVFFSGGSLGDSANNFSFGFVNTTSGSNYSNLYVNADLSGATPSQRESEFYFRAGSFNMSNASTTPLGTFTEPVTALSQSYFFELSVTRLADGYQIDYYRDDSLVSSLSITPSNNPNSFLSTAALQDITGIAFRHSNIPGITNTYLDNIRVTIVPEPHAAGLLALGAAGLLLRRNRRRMMLSMK